MSTDIFSQPIVSSSGGRGFTTQNDMTGIRVANAVYTNGSKPLLVEAYVEFLTNNAGSVLLAQGQTGPTAGTLLGVQLCSPPLNVLPNPNTHQSMFFFVPSGWAYSIATIAVLPNVVTIQRWIEVT